MWTESRKNDCDPCVGHTFIVLVACVCSLGVLKAQEDNGEWQSLLDSVLNIDPTADVKLLKSCAYTQQTIIQDVGSMQERFDPSAGVGKEWQLVQLNGEQPTARQIHDYEPKPRQRHPAVLNFDFIERESVQLLDDSQSKLKFGFKVLPSKATEWNQSVTHQLTIDSNTGQLLEMDSFAQESFRIQRWTQVTEYENVSTFRFEVQTASTVLETITIKLGVKSGSTALYHEVTKQFSDFDCTNSSSSKETKNTDGGGKEPRIPGDETLNSEDSSNR